MLGEILGRGASVAARILSGTVRNVRDIFWVSFRSVFERRIEPNRDEPRLEVAELLFESTVDAYNDGFRLSYVDEYVDSTREL